MRAALRACTSNGPRLPDAQLREVAEELRDRIEREVNDPEHAAVEWLRQGIPGDAVG